jgi:hypothetical protein
MSDFSERGQISVNTKLISYIDSFWINTKKIFSFPYVNLFSLIFVGIIFNNVLCIYQRVLNYAISPDEVDNVHNAWSVFNKLVVYKDFFDFKAPLYTFINSFLISVSDIPASFNTIIFIRLIHFFVICLVGVLIYIIAKELKFSTAAAFFSVACFYMWDVTSTFGFEVRPEGFQVLLMLTGFYFFISNYKKTDKKLPFFIVGICFGLMLFIGFHSLAFLIAFFSFNIYGYVISGDKYFFEKSHQLIFLGFSIVFLCVGLYFLINGGFRDFQSLYFVYNLDFSAIPDWTKKYNAETLNKFFLQGDLYLVLLTTLGFCSFDYSKESNKLIFTILSMTVLLYVFVGFHPTYTLIFVPFCCLIAASFIEKFLIENFYKEQKFTLRKIAVLFSLYILFMNFSGNTLKYQSEIYTLDIDRQRANLNWVLKNIDRSEEVALSKHACPAYIFNKDIRYFKRPGFHENKIARRNLGTDDLFETIEKKNTQLFFAHPSELEWTDPKVKEFLTKNFDLLEINDYDQSNCIWVRKTVK